MKQERIAGHGVDQVAKYLLENWGTKTLEALRMEAKAEQTGVMYDAIRIAGGRRLMIVICVTTKDQIATLRGLFDFADSGAPADWTKLTLLETVMRAQAGPGYAHESLRDETGDVSAIVLISAEPRSMAMIERVFGIPK
jgi:hypothetical protein